jgi:hypothetical protein
MSAATYLRTDTIPVDQLTPYPGNAKRGDVPAILASLRKNGQYRGLVVRQQPDSALVVLAGNHTRQALAEHGPRRLRHQGVRRVREQPGLDAGRALRRRGVRRPHRAPGESRG